MILDFLTIAFIVSGLILIFWMWRERRRDVLRYRYVENRAQAKLQDGKSDAVEPGSPSIVPSNEIMRLRREIEEALTKPRKETSA